MDTNFIYDMNTRTSGNPGLDKIVERAFVDKRNEKVLDAVKKALDEIGLSDRWTIELAGGWNEPTSIETKTTNGKLIK